MDECVAVAVAEAVAVAVTEAVAEADQSIHDQSIHDPSIRAGCGGRGGVHRGVTLVSPWWDQKGKGNASLGQTVAKREKGKRPTPKWNPDLTGQCHRAAHARTRRNDFPVGGPGGLTPQPPMKHPLDFLNEVMLLENVRFELF